MTTAVVDLASEPPASQVGGKAARLGWLIARGWDVPSGVVVPFSATAVLATDDGAQRVAEELSVWMEPGRAYCVRSSANVEDHGRQTFAGQFTSVTGVTGVADALSGIREVAASIASPQVHAYATRVGVEPESLRMAVIVQHMVDPVISGVAFSHDPVTGADHVVVEAVGGSGERLMGRGADAQRWTTDHRGTTQGPREPLLPADVVTLVVDTVRGIAAASGETVDLEWVWNGRDLRIVQWRPISSLARRPRIWSSRMARDMLPGLIPPLVWSVNVPVLSRTWVAIVHEALGHTDLVAEELVRPFGYRAYFNATAFGRVFESLGMPADALEQMREGGGAGMRPSIGALARRAPALAGFARTLSRWPRHALPILTDVEHQQRADEQVDLAGLTDAQLIERVDTLRDRLGRIGRLNIITPLLADARTAAIRRIATRAGIDPDTVDPGQELPAVRAFSPAHALSRMEPGDERAWSDFLARFGHLSDSPNDCSRPTWAEQPEAVRASLLGSGAHTPQVLTAGVADAREALLAAVPAWRRARVRRGWSRTALLRLLRERIGYTYARVYGLVRPAFLEAGVRLVDRGVLAQRDDVFLLTLDELRTALGGGLPAADGLVRERRAEMAEAADLRWPERIVGDDPVPVRGRRGARVLQGVPTSHGRHTGPARVVTSLATAGDIGADDVLVLPAADVTWTPLLLRAGAVVTETGGMLSHASIVARELGLPCVASVASATEIPSGTMVCVDGAAGEVVLLTGRSEG